MNTTNEIAAAMNVSANQIKSVTELYYVYCVVVFGRRATFVSKKAVESIAIKMPKLMGTVRMVEWAERIRANTIAKLGDRIDLIEHCLTQATAQFWITNRSYGRDYKQYNMIFANDLSAMLKRKAQFKLAIDTLLTA